MSKRLTFKSVLSLIVILFTAFFLVGCGDTDQELVDAALSDVALVFATGDSATSVTQNLSLPTTVGETVTITWSSDKTAVISNAGVVVRPAFGQPDSTVVLTGTLTMGEATATKAFILVVKAMLQTDQQVVDAAVPNVAITYATGDSATMVTADLVLPATAGAVTVTWSSDTPAVVSNAGVVVRPAKGAADATVVLTATLTKGTATATKTFTLTVHALQYTDQDLVHTAVNSLVVGYTTGDTVHTVTSDVTLPALSGTVAVTWTSNIPTVISNDGVVVRPAKGEANATVILTATLTLGDAEETKTFTLTVLAIPYTEEDAATALEISGTDLTYNTELSRYVTTGDITLPGTSLGFDVVWTSTNDAVLSNLGVAVRPAWGLTDSTVILTATIGDETKDFTVTVSAITVKPAEIILQEAKDVLLLAGVGDGVAADITLPTAAGSEGVTVTWVSDTPELVTNAGVVTRPLDGDVTVTLTATLHLGDATLTKEFDVVVLTFEPYTEVADIAAALALYDPEALKPTYVEIPDVTVVGVFLTGFMIYDGTTLFQVYTESIPPAKVVDGAVFTVRGMVDYYMGSMELVGDANSPIILIDSSATAAVLAPRVITGPISDYVATLPTTYSKTSPTQYEYLTITVKVRNQDPLDKYATVLVNSDYTGGDIITSGAATTIANNALMIYYKSNIDTVRLFDGLEITFNVFLLSLRDDKDIYQVVFTGQVEDIETTLDDAGIVGVVKSSLETSYELAYAEATTISLPTTLLGSTVVWDTASEYVDVATGAVTMPTTPGQVVVTLTATITRGLATDTATVTFKVGELAVITMLEVHSMADGELIRIQGIYAAQTKSTAFWIQDSTAGLNIYASGAFLTQLQGLAVGVELEMFGTLDIFNGLYEITNITAINVINATPAMPTPVSLNDVEFSNTGLLPYQGQLVSFEGFLLKYDVNASTSSFNFTLYNPITGYQIAARAESSVTGFAAIVTYLNALEVNTPIDIVGGVIGWYNNYQLAITGSSNFVAGTLTDAHKVALDAAAITVPSTVITATTLTLPATGTNGSAIAWVSDDAAIDATTGVVTIPASTQVTVTLTATLTLGDETKEVTFVVLVGQTELQKIEADAAALSIPELLLDAAPITANMPALGVNGSTIVWATDNATIITTAGTVTLPTVGQETVTLTATLTLGTETKEVVFVVVVGVPDPVADEPTLDLFISEYLEPSTGNSKALEFYNPTNATIDLSNYQLLHYNNGKLTVAIEYQLTLAGTLAPGETFVVYNLDSDPAMIALIQANADVYMASPAYVSGSEGGGVMGFNGDDAIVLMKKDTSGDFTVVVDSIGAVVGVDPGSAWVSTDTLVSTANMTLVRKGTVIYGRTDIASDFDPSVEWVPFAAQTWTNLGTHVVYSPDLFISEYVEPSTGNSKALELYNNTNTTIDLSNYQLLHYNNGKLTVAIEYQLTLAGTLAPGETFVVYNLDSDPAMIALIQANADVYMASPAYVSGSEGGGVMGFNGDDAIVLMKKDTSGDFTVVVDSIGAVVGVDPGSAWVSTDTLVSTANMTLVRKVSVLVGRTDITADFDPSVEWVPFAAQTWTELGSHTMN